MEVADSGVPIVEDLAVGAPITPRTTLRLGEEGHLETFLFTAPGNGEPMSRNIVEGSLRLQNPLARQDLRLHPVDIVLDPASPTTLEGTDLRPVVPNDFMVPAGEERRTLIDQVDGLVGEEFRFRENLRPVPSVADVRSKRHTLTFVLEPINPARPESAVRIS